ncbi:MAG: DUF6671 family protein [Bacteroidota bacterium]
MDDFFLNRKAVIATKHHKEFVIAPVLKQEFFIDTVVPSDFDTDSFGTFSGEVERTEDPITILRKKCEWGMEKTQLDMAFASEGSFGPHPSFMMLPSDDELVMLYDKKNDITLVGRELSFDTNFDGKNIVSWNDLLEFAEKSDFPSHALILKKSKNDLKGMVKGIQSREQLRVVYDSLKDKQGRVFVETDMRAHLNPTRMRIIEKAVYHLIKKMKSRCPECGYPGFEVQEIKRGLPCKVCGTPTNSILSQMLKCKKCEYEKEILFPDKKVTEEPMYCDVCNP